MTEEEFDSAGYKAGIMAIARAVHDQQPPDGSDQAVGIARDICRYGRPESFVHDLNVALDTVGTGMIMASLPRQQAALLALLGGNGHHVVAIGPREHLPSRTKEPERFARYFAQVHYLVVTPTGLTYHQPVSSDELQQAEETVGTLAGKRDAEAEQLLVATRAALTEVCAKLRGNIAVAQGALPPVTLAGVAHAETLLSKFDHGVVDTNEKRTEMLGSLLAYLALLLPAVNERLTLFATLSAAQEVSARNAAQHG